MIYKCYDELKNNILKLNDRIEFNHESYNVSFTVDDEYLVPVGKIHNQNKIFEILGLNAFDFCEQHYANRNTRWEKWKIAHPSHWPAYAIDDYESITKVVLELFRLIEEPEKLKETSEILFID